MTEGLDGLRDRLLPYAGLGARFAKWRAVYAMGAGAPSRTCIEASAQALARHAALCQEAGPVPIVEPEVLKDGAHTMRQCGEATRTVLRAVFRALCDQRVLVEGIVLKPAMVLPGSARRAADSRQGRGGDRASLAARRAGRRAGDRVPLRRPAGALGTARLNATDVLARSCGARLPWTLSFSFARALQRPALEIWRGSQADMRVAQAALIHRKTCNRAARRGEYQALMEAA